MACRQYGTEFASTGCGPGTCEERNRKSEIEPAVGHYYGLQGRRSPDIERAERADDRFRSRTLQTCASDVTGSRPGEPDDEVSTRAAQPAALSGDPVSAGSKRKPIHKPARCSGKTRLTPAKCEPACIRAGCDHALGRGRPPTPRADGAREARSAQPATVA